MLLRPWWTQLKVGVVVSGYICTRLHGQQKLSLPRNDQRLRNLTFAGWSQECLTSTRPRMCCLLRPSWFASDDISPFILPSRVSCVHIQTCTTHKLVVDRIQAYNWRCPLMPWLVFLWLAPSGLFCHEFLIVSSYPELNFGIHCLDDFIQIFPIIVKKDNLFIF